MNAPNLYIREGRVTLGTGAGARVFAYPGLDFDFSIKEDLQAFSVAVVRLYNPAPDTIAASEPRVVAGKIVPVDIKIEAGYVDNQALAFTGGIKQSRVELRGVDRVLELTCSDDTKWANLTSNEAVRNKTISEVLTYISAGKGQASIRVGEDRKFTGGLIIRDPLKTLTKLCMESQSYFTFRNGNLTVIPYAMTVDKNAIVDVGIGRGQLEYPKRYVDTENEGPKKNKKVVYETYQFRTIFLPTVGSGSSVEFNRTATEKARGVLVWASKKFSTFEGDAECELRARIVA